MPIISNFTETEMQQIFINAHGVVEYDDGTFDAGDYEGLTWEMWGDTLPTEDIFNGTYDAEKHLEHLVRVRRKKERRNRRDDKKPKKKLELHKMSIEELKALAADAAQMIKDLQKEAPSIGLAEAHGVKNVSYNTVRHGRVLAWEGTATITMANGDVWEAKGYPQRGCPEWIHKMGGVDFKKIS